MAFDFNRGAGGSSGTPNTGSGFNSGQGFGGGFGNGGSKGGSSGGFSFGSGSGNKGSSSDNKGTGSGGGFTFGQNNKPNTDPGNTALTDPNQNSHRENKPVVFDNYRNLRGRGRSFDLGAIPWKLIFYVILIGAGVTLVVTYWDEIVGVITRLLALLFTVAISLWCIRKIIFPNR